MADQLPPKYEWLTHVDDHQRIYVPSQVVRAAEWTVGELVRISVKEGQVMIERVSLSRPKREGKNIRKAAP